MKIHRLITFLVLGLMLTARLMADEDIDVDLSATISPSDPTPVVSTDVKTADSTSADASTSSATTQAAGSTSAENPAEEPAEVLAPTPVPGRGVLKMKDVYKAGLVYYKQEDYASAIRYLRQSLQIHDPYTPKFYYAEANAILGVIFQFHIIDKESAYEYYKEALSIDPTTATAKKHIKEVTPNTDSQ